MTPENQLPRFSFLLFAPLVLVIVVAAYVGERQSATERSDQLWSRAETAAATLSRSLEQSASTASILSLATFGRAGCADALATAQEAYSFVGLVRSDGRLVCVAPAGAVEPDVADRSWFAEVSETGRAAYGGYRVNPATGDEVMVVAHPAGPALADDAAFVVVAVRLSWLAEGLMAGMREGSAGLVVTDPSDTVIATSLDDVPRGARLDTPDAGGPVRADLAGSSRDVVVRDLPLGTGAFHVVAVAPARGLMTGSPWMFAALALVVLLFGLAAFAIIWRRLPRDEGGPGGTAEASWLPAEPHNLGPKLDEMDTLLKTRTVALNEACELAGLGTWTLLPDMESVRTMANMRAILGFPDDEEVARIDTFRERIVPEDRAVFDAAFARSLEERQMIEAEFRAIGAGGEVRFLRARTGPSGALPDDTQGGISGIVQDITDLRRNETALARSLKLVRLAGEAARVSGWRYEIATRKLSGTRDTARLVGPEGSDGLMIEDVIARFIDEEERMRVERGFWTCVGAGSRFDEIGRFRRLDGKETWLRVIGEAERDTSGNIVAVYGATQDVGEMMRARFAAEEVRELLQTILDSLDDGFVIHDHDGKIQYMNRKAHSILGVAELNLVDQNIWQDLPPEVGPHFERLVGAALETGESQNFEGEIGVNGHWIAVAVHPTPAGVAIYLNDVTEDREARERLRLLDAAVSRLNDVVLITEASELDPPGPRIVFVNDAFEKDTGFSREEALGATPRILQGPETEKERLQAIREALENHGHVRTELTNYRKDGTRFTSEIDINPLFNEAGECTHFVAVQRDRTSRQETEKRLRAREEQFRLASLASRDIIWDWDMQTGIIWNSEDSDEIFGPLVAQWHIEKVPERHIEHVLERIHPEDRLKITESLDAALSGDAESWRCEYRIRAKDGTWRYLTDKAFILRDDEGTPRRMVGAMSDVTDIRALDAQLHQSQKLETVGQLTGGIAHDFNNLLTIILGNCDMLLDDVDDESALRPLIQSIEDAAERGARFSSDLLAFSRRQPLELRPTDINDLIRRSSSLFSRAVDASVEIEYELTDSPTVAHVDPDKMQAALLNLVLNAMAAIKEDGRIIVRTRRVLAKEGDLPSDCDPGEYIEVDVADDGSGMSPEVVEHAFEPFFTTREPGVGTGMGLSSVYGLVKQSGGHAGIVSEPGKGTTVTLSLSVADEAEIIDIEGTPKAHHRGGGQRILVVEDDTELRSFVCTILSRMEYRLVEAKDGSEALKMLKKEDDFDLLFTDIVMPGSINGVELARKAQKLHPGLKVLFTSGYARETLSKERQAPSDIPMLHKPFRTNDLVVKVQDVLSNDAEPDS
ncbi:PAS domain S-box protein [Sinisalibacter lacisalsi]|nr:PAS domain S-box protein [Sinisalibacter lacisalsi]